MTDIKLGLQFLQIWGPLRRVNLRVSEAVLLLGWDRKKKKKRMLHVPVGPFGGLRCGGKGQLMPELPGP